MEDEMWRGSSWEHVLGIASGTILFWEVVTKWRQRDLFLLKINSSVIVAVLPG